MIVIIIVGNNYNTTDLQEKNVAKYLYNYFDIFSFVKSSMYIFCDEF